MIYNTPEILFIVYINKFLTTKHVFLPHERNFTLIYGPFSCKINVLFGQIFMDFFLPFFKCSLNFKAHALQSELNKV